MTDAGCEVIDISEEDQIKMRENATSAYALIRESVGDENMDKVLAAVDALEKSENFSQIMMRRTGNLDVSGSLL